MDAERTCIGCRSRDYQASLVRFVARNGSVFFDAHGVEAGRGAWIHPTVQCFESALTRKAFGRALRTTVNITAEAREVFERTLTHIASVPLHQTKAERLMDN